MGLGPLPPAANILRTAISGLKSLEPWANVLHFAWSGATPTVANLHTVAVDIANLWNTYMAPRQTSDTAMTGIKLTDLTTSMGAQTEDPFAVYGTNGEDPIPNQVCVLVDYPVALRYRGGHPRTYVVAGGDGDLTPGSGNWNQWNDSFLAAMGTSWQDFTDGVSAISVGGTNIDLLKGIRYVHAGIYLPVPIQLDLPSFTIGQVVATQRRRTGRRG